MFLADLPLLCFYWLSTLNSHRFWKLGSERIHVDANTLEEGLIHVIGHYAEFVWKMKF